jgi:hypothetical protein
MEPQSRLIAVVLVPDALSGDDLCVEPIRVGECLDLPVRVEGEAKKENQ